MMADRFGIERADSNVGVAARGGPAGCFAPVAKTAGTLHAHQMRPLPKGSALMLLIRHQLAQTGV